MKIVALPFKIGGLMTLAILLISATGYLSYRSLSSIVNSIQVKSRPDLRLFTIRELSSELEKAEKSVRMFIYTGKNTDIEPYYKAIAEFDNKIISLRTASSKDSMLLVQLDTISQLIADNIVIWNRMLDLYHTDTLDIFIRKLNAKLAVQLLSDKNSDRSILRRVFSKRDENIVAQEEIIRDLNKIEEQQSLQNTRILETESQLAETGNKIRERFYFLITQMENEIIRSVEANAKAADKLALNTYRWLAMFALLGTVLVIVVLVIVVRFVRKTRDYQEALIRSKAEAEALARTKELFMANMSHEIRTPVSAIYGFAEQLQYQAGDEKSREIAGIIRSSSEHLVKIVNDILDFSKLQHGALELESVHFLIRRVCEEVQLLFGTSALANQTRLSFTISKSTPLVLLGDPYRLKQILINLVGNAVKFTHQGEVHFSVDCVMKSAPNLSLILKVADNGIGIREELHEKVFEDFTQAETNTTRKHGGTGLGLSIVKKLVELHEGTITLKSRENEGTTVTCILPYAAGNWELVPAEAQPLPVPDKLRAIKALIVDDEAYNRQLFLAIMRRWKISCDEAKDGLQALDMIKTNRYDLVFMDIRMPGLDGLKTTARIRKELHYSMDDLPVIGISATLSTEEKEQGMLSGMNTFLPKPFAESMLLDVFLSLKEKEAEKSVPPGIMDNDQPKTRHVKVNFSNLYHLAGQDSAFVRQMLTGFLSGTEKGLGEIADGVQAGDFDMIMEAAHRISAPCKHLEASDLYAMLKAIEDQAKNHKNIAKLARLSADLKKNFAEIEKIVQEHMAKMTE